MKKDSKDLLAAIIVAIVIFAFAWSVGGLILMLAIRYCLFFHNVADKLGVADLSYVNYANACLLFSVLSFNYKKKD